jgi:hypothetical protein
VALSFKQLHATLGGPGLGSSLTIFNALPHSAAVAVAQMLVQSPGAVRLLACHMTNRLPDDVLEAEGMPQFHSLRPCDTLALLGLTASRDPIVRKFAAYMTAACLHQGEILDASLVFALPTMAEVRDLERAAGIVVLDSSYGTCGSYTAWPAERLQTARLPYRQGIVIAHVLFWAGLGWLTKPKPTPAALAATALAVTNGAMTWDASLEVVNYLLGPANSVARTELRRRYRGCPWFPGSLLDDVTALCGLRASWMVACVTLGFVVDGKAMDGNDVMPGPAAPYGRDGGGCVWSDAPDASVGVDIERGRDGSSPHKRRCVA